MSSQQHQHQQQQCSWPHLTCVLAPLLLLLLLVVSPQMASATAESLLAQRVNRTYMYKLGVPGLNSTGGQADYFNLDDISFPGGYVSVYTKEMNDEVVKMLQYYASQHSVPAERLNFSTCVFHSPWKTRGQDCFKATLNIAMASDCTFPLPLCCALYWVTNSTPRGLPLRKVRDAVLWNHHAAQNGFYTNFAHTDTSVSCDDSPGPRRHNPQHIAVDIYGLWGVVTDTSRYMMSEEDISDSPSDMAAAAKVFGEASSQSGADDDGSDSQENSRHGGSAAPTAANAPPLSALIGVMILLVLLLIFELVIFFILQQHAKAEVCRLTDEVSSEQSLLDATASPEGSPRTWSNAEESASATSMTYRNDGADEDEKIDEEEYDGKETEEAEESEEDEEEEHDEGNGYDYHNEDEEEEDSDSNSSEDNASFVAESASQVWSRTDSMSSLKASPRAVPPRPSQPVTPIEITTLSPSSLKALGVRPASAQHKSPRHAKGLVRRSGTAQPTPPPPQYPVDNPLRPLRRRLSMETIATAYTARSSREYPGPASPYTITSTSSNNSIASRP